jgi:hypothetical protein
MFGDQFLVACRWQVIRRWRAACRAETEFIRPEEELNEYCLKEEIRRTLPLKLILLSEHSR